jgi:hypothetical protein
VATTIHATIAAIKLKFCNQNPLSYLMRYLHSLIYHMHRRRTPKNHIFKKKLTLLCSTRCFSTLFATLFDATQTLLRRNSDASQTLLCSTRCFSTLFDATQAVRKRYSALLDAFRRYTMLLDATQTLLRRYSDATQTLLRRYSDATQTLRKCYSTHQIFKQKQ